MYNEFVLPADVRSKSWKQPPKKPPMKKRNLGKKVRGKMAAKRQMVPHEAPMAPEIAAVVRRIRSDRLLKNASGEVKSFL